jgi:hypothetical protein
VTAAEAVMKPRRENGATFVSPMTSDVRTGSALMMDFLRSNLGAHSASDRSATQITSLRESIRSTSVADTALVRTNRGAKQGPKNKAVGAV